MEVKLTVCGLSDQRLVGRALRGRARLKQLNRVAVAIVFRSGRALIL